MSRSKSGASLLGVPRNAARPPSRPHSSANNSTSVGNYLSRPGTAQAEHVPTDCLSEGWESEDDSGEKVVEFLRSGVQARRGDDYDVSYIYTKTHTHTYMRTHVNTYIHTYINTYVHYIHT
jgi:hypothetical protein